MKALTNKTMNRWISEIIREVDPDLSETTKSKEETLHITIFGF